MALDGITIASIVAELNEKLLGGRIDKIHQPLVDEINFTVRSLGTTYKVLASANSSHPRIHITSSSKENPASPPMFCMVLRKYISGGKIVKIYQPNFERIIIMEIESRNEMGDITIRQLLIEMMGKHSNIILLDHENKILDSIKRVSHDTSSVREVLPGKEYVFPPSHNKIDPRNPEKNQFFNLLQQQSGIKLQEFLYKNYTGISPIMASEICFVANLDASNRCIQLTEEEKNHLFNAFCYIMDETIENKYSYSIIFEPKTHKIIDFFVLKMKQFHHYDIKQYSCVSELLEDFYQKRDTAYHIRQKSHDMRRFILSNIERCVKKREILVKTRKTTTSKEIWKLKGELLTANIYAIQKGMTSFKTVNFYDETLPEIEIALDPTKTPSENAQKYFNKYNKAKRTLVALDVQEKQNNEELQYLESILNSLESADDEADLIEIRNELTDAGYLKKKNTKKGLQKKNKKSRPLHFKSSDNFDIYVGKSNLQNDELTLRFAESFDIWMHTKNIPGSHVIIRTNGNENIPNSTLLEAANLAAFYSKGKTGSNVPVDYTQKKNVKKPNGAKPGMVIYEKNKTIYITPDEQQIQNLETSNS